MGFRFNKRIKIAKGVSLNVGKKGVSTSVRVGNVTLNSKGRATASIPGTGMSYSTNVTKGKSSNTKGKTIVTHSEVREFKNKYVAFVVVLFLGIFGVHYFYQGLITKGVIYLLTGGVFGIGWLIDVFKYFIKLFK